MEKDQNIRINCLVTKELRDRVKIKAVKEGKTVTEVVNNFLKEWVRK